MKQLRILISRPDRIGDVCNNIALNRNTYNLVRLRNIEFSNSRYSLGNGIECIPSELVLRDEEDSITCTVTGSGISTDAPSYMTVLRVEIEYGYTESVSKEIKIKKAS